MYPMWLPPNFPKIMNPVVLKDWQQVDFPAGGYIYGKNNNDAASEVPMRVATYTVTKPKEKIQPIESENNITNDSTGESLSNIVQDEENIQSKGNKNLDKRRRLKKEELINFIKNIINEELKKNINKRKSIG